MPTGLPRRSGVSGASGSSLTPAPTGVAAVGRFAGVTTSGAPSTGTFLQGDFVVDQTGQMYVCTTAGSPGTWVSVGGGIELGHAANTSGTPPTFTTEADLSGVTVTFTVGSRPVYVHGFAPLVTNDTVSKPVLFKITDEANTEKSRNLAFSEVAAHGFSMNVWERIATPGTYTRKVRVSNNGAGGTATVYTTVTGGAWIRAVTA